MTCLSCYGLHSPNCPLLKWLLSWKCANSQEREIIIQREFIFALMLKLSEHGEYEYEACTNVLFEMK